MAVTIFAGFMALTWLSLRVPHPHPAAAELGEREKTLLLRSEAVVIFIPSALQALARELPDVAAIQTHDDVKRCLKQRGLEQMWYAVLFRGFESTGNVAEMAIYSRPFEASQKLPEFQAVLASLRGSPPTAEHIDYAKATISLIPEELATAEPATVIAQVIRRSELAEPGTDQ